MKNDKGVAYHTELIIVPGFKLVRGYHVTGLLEQKGFEARPAVSVKLECRIGPFATKAEAEEVARTLQIK